MTGGSDILISVQRKYVCKILSGDKSVELRRRNIHVTPGTRVWIYSTAPKAAVEAVALVEAVVSGAPSWLWKNYRSVTGVTYQEFVSYFRNSPVGHAIVLRNVRKLRPGISLSDIRKQSESFHPPQFYIKLGPDSPTLRYLTRMQRRFK